MSSEINKTGDCTGCGMHIEPQFDGDEWDYCECDAYTYEIFDGAILLDEDVLRATSDAEAIEDVQRMLEELAENKKGQLLCKLTGPEKQIFEINI
jgi:hypothetical protein